MQQDTIHYMLACNGHGTLVFLSAADCELINYNWNVGEETSY